MAEPVTTRMPPLSLTAIIPVLQVAVGPVILISGVGLLLLTMTNRYSRQDIHLSLVALRLELEGATKE